MAIAKMSLYCILKKGYTSRINLMQMNTKIVERHKNWNILLFEEATKIKEKTTLNAGLEVSKELQLFSTD